MRRSEKTLLAIFLLVVLAWQGERLVNRSIVVPIQRGHARLAELDQELAEQDRQTASLQRVADDLAAWRRRSLPPDPFTAQRLYQQWLTDLAQDCGFRAPKVFPDRVSPKHDACLGVMVSIDAEATLSQLCLFLSRFYRTDLAQQIVALNIDSTQDQGDPVLRVTILAEGLSLPTAEPRQRLFLTGALTGSLDNQQTTARVTGAEALPLQTRMLIRIDGEYLEGVKVADSEWQVQRGADRSTAITHQNGARVEFIPLVDQAMNSPSADYAALVAGNPFARPTPKVVQRPPPVEERPPPIDPAAFTYLVAAFAQNDQRQAWFYDRLNNQNVVIGSGQPFAIAGIEGVVEEIGDDFVLLDHADARWRLRLGKNLRSMERVGDP